MELLSLAWHLYWLTQSYLTSVLSQLHTPQPANRPSQIDKKQTKKLVGKHFIDLKHAHMADKKVSVCGKEQKECWNGATSDTARHSIPFWVLRLRWESERTRSADKHLLVSVVVFGVLEIEMLLLVENTCRLGFCELTWTKCVDSWYVMYLCYLMERLLLLDTYTAVINMTVQRRGLAFFSFLNLYISRSDLHCHAFQHFVSSFMEPNERWWNKEMKQTHCI